MNDFKITYNYSDNFKYQSYMLLNGLYYELQTDTGILGDNKWVPAPHTITIAGNTEVIDDKTN